MSDSHSSAGGHHGEQVHRSKGFGYFNTAARFKQAVEVISESVIRRLYPPPRYAIVDSIDFTNRKVTVHYPEDATNTFTVPCATVMPAVTSVTVRLAGPLGARYVDEVLDGQIYMKRVNLNGTPEVTLAQSGPLLIGDESGGNLTADSNEIQARNSGASATLNLNPHGGSVHVSDDGNLNRVVINAESSDRVMQLQRSSTGRPFIGFYNEQADTTQVRKGYIGYPTAQSDGGFGMIVLADVGECLVQATNGDVRLAAAGGDINLDFNPEADGGLVIGQHPTYTTYDSLRARNHTGNEYFFLWNAGQHLISAPANGTVYIRPDANSTSVELRVNPTEVNVIGELAVTGKVLTTDQAAVSVYKTSDQTVTTAGDVITFQTENYDKSSNFASNRYTADEDGPILVVFQALFNSGPGNVRIKKNGSIANNYAGYGANPTEVSGGKNVSLTAVIYLASGDYIEICAGTNTSQEVYGDASNGHTRFDVYQLP